MGDIFIRGLPFPPHVRGATIKDSDGNFNIYINEALCPEMQRATIDHEMRHIRLEHLYDDTTAYANEWEATF